MKSLLIVAALMMVFLGATTTEKRPAAARLVSNTDSLIHALDQSTQRLNATINKIK